MSFEYPEDLAPSTVSFINEFFKATDDPHSDYTQYFAPTGRMIIGGGQVLEGHAAIQERRDQVANAPNITSRLHATEKVYWAGKRNDILLTGALQYGLADGTKSPKLDYAAKMLFAEGSPLKLQEYKVWMDSASLAKVLSPKKS